MFGQARCSAVVALAVVYCLLQLWCCFECVMGHTDAFHPLHFLCRGCCACPV